MRTWIVVIVLYAVGIGFFQLLGGLGAAAGALRRWGKVTSSLRGSGASSS